MPVGKKFFYYNFVPLRDYKYVDKPKRNNLLNMKKNKENFSYLDEFSNYKKINLTFQPASYKTIHTILDLW